MDYLSVKLALTMLSGPMSKQDQSISLPSADLIHQAIAVYLSCAYGGDPPESLLSVLPPRGAFDAAEYLMSDCVERIPPKANLDEIRSFTLRLGNWAYPHMKLRLSRPPNDPVFLFAVDCHDEFLRAAEGSPDAEPLAELKEHNVRLAANIEAAWAQAGLPTEKSFLRDKIEKARKNSNK